MREGVVGGKHIWEGYKGPVLCPQDELDSDWKDTN